MAPLNHYNAGVDPRRPGDLLEGFCHGRGRLPCPHHKDAIEAGERQVEVFDLEHRRGWRLTMQRDSPGHRRPSAGSFHGSVENSSRIRAETSPCGTARRL